MGLKHTVETIGELRAALTGVSDDAPFQLLDSDGGVFVTLAVQSFYEQEPKCFVVMKVVE